MDPLIGIPLVIITIGVTARGLYLLDQWAKAQTANKQANTDLQKSQTDHLNK